MFAGAVGIGGGVDGGIGVVVDRGGEVPPYGESAGWDGVKAASEFSPVWLNCFWAIVGARTAL